MNPSIRNQLPGTVTEVHTGEVMATVRVRPGRRPLPDRRHHPGGLRAAPYTPWCRPPGSPWSARSERTAPPENPGGAVHRRFAQSS
ncbi:TOBE domain-containing protein [Streptomyces sp. SCL15-4]|uniref:TOBE domain-containing protein n=1 Tax=Streptomyces sp. SCL15-4 TaxID=2967221 RepID=UPI00398FFB1A